MSRGRCWNHFGEPSEINFKRKMTSPHPYYKRGEDQVRISKDPDKDKKKRKKEQSWFENYIYAVMEKSMKDCLE